MEPRDGAVATVRLSAHLANEFLCKKDYLKNWDIEVHEEYGVFTVDEWRAALARNFFDGAHDNDVRERMDPTKSIPGSRQGDGAERHLLLAGDERGHYRGETVTPAGVMGVAVDLAIFTVQEARLELLLIRMKREPYTGKWALPGGRIRGDETVEQAAARELHEKAGHHATSTWSSSTPSPSRAAIPARAASPSRTWR